ncbi:colanic acid biosynthesis glycosyltransferase WcaI [Dysgonomonas sp. 216]|uniref:WcaI family glycosyltransferase n=1 Tax=Dysgonomonas sp. 216 TaxID=2302934 RepID=UPI0013D1F5BE|nr:WcaI family glycosyltransferase [Dysgonomonas sp. 216]NDW19752.1 colanic acid biosynthesis glycosyltransferase WcaI [Dysgonomonas sp. 216]
MRILIYGINYSPELTGIGKYSGEMAEWLASNGHDVSVFTAMPYYPEWEIHAEYKGKLWKKETKNGVKVYRCPLYIPKRNKNGKKVSSKKRILHETSFAINSSFRWLGAMFRKKYDLVICVSPPFHLSLPALIYSKLKGAKLVTHIQDLQIDAAMNLNMLSNGTALNTMFKLERFLLKKSNYVSTLTKGMRNKIEAKGVSPSKVIMLPNWVDLNTIRPLPKEQSLRKKFDIPLDDIVILYSGNMGEKQGLEIVIDAATALKNRKDIHFVMVGSGVGREKLEEMVNQQQLTNVKFYPLQPYEDLPALLAMADIHLVLQKKKASDLVMPSKLTGILAVGGCAVITALPKTSLYEVTEEHNMGILCEPESSEALLAAIEKAMDSDLSEIKKNAYNYAIKYLNKDAILSDFIEMVK